MSKVAIYCLAMAVSLGVTAGAAQARQISVWGNNFQVDDGPAVAPAQPSFKALADDADSSDMPRRHRVRQSH